MNAQQSGEIDCYQQGDDSCCTLLAGYSNLLCKFPLTSRSDSGAVGDVKREEVSSDDRQ